jgi:hypothetical protein
MSAAKLTKTIAAATANPIRQTRIAFAVLHAFGAQC